ncbi:hypothetical protein MJ904_27050 [Massilia sp. MB5]|uniref:hypothetical protein n=1 Tax=Massilia sp. MB5 TaxID=2919578 RepID=UPI001F0E609A|nr:hypothetical protein [Massilia sp. MB5]UMR30574.1 hypothetical protein MJ904_27050 [Massilia sp. MB5]
MKFILGNIDARRASTAHGVPTEILPASQEIRKESARNCEKKAIIGKSLPCTTQTAKT